MHARIHATLARNAIRNAASRSATTRRGTRAVGNDRCFAVALALREQILEAGQVPAGVLDWKVDVIVGPDGVVVAAPSSAPSGGAAP